MKKRTHRCGSLSKSDEGKDVVLMGWVNTRRDHGGLIFVDLRDREGITQVVINPQAGTTEAAKNIRNEFVIVIEGVVKARPQGMINGKIKTGEIEVEAKALQVLSEAETLPFAPEDESVNENVKTKISLSRTKISNAPKETLLKIEICSSRA